MGRRPSPELGEKNLDCEFYAECLDEAARRDWNSFCCDKCPVFQGEALMDGDDLMAPERDEAVKLCEECADKPVISKGSRLCASCMARRRSNKASSAKKKTKKEKRPQGRPPKKRAPATLKENRDTREDDTLVQVNFAGYEDILTRLKQDALDHVRTLEGEIIWVLKNNERRS